MRKGIGILGLALLAGAASAGTPTIDGTLDAGGVWTKVGEATDGLSWAMTASELYYAADSNYLYFAGSKTTGDDWPMFAFAADDATTAGGSQEVWGRQITYDHATKPDVIYVGNWDNGWAELRTWNGSGFDGAGDSRIDDGDSVVSVGRDLVEVRIPKSALPALGSTVNVQFYISGNNPAEHGTFDSIPDDEVADSWNESGDPNSLSNYLTLPTSAPATPSVPDLATGSDTGASDTDNITSDNTPTLTGTADADVTVSIFATPGGLLGTTTSDGSGNWSFTVSSALPDGDVEFTAVASNEAGSSDASAALEITVDTVAPLVSMSADRATKVGGDIEGTYSITESGSGTGSPTLYAREINGAWASDGSETGNVWKFTPPSAGTYVFELVVEDLAGNPSGAAPSGSTGVGSAEVIYNTADNAAFTHAAFPGVSALTFPMEDGLNVVVALSNVTTTGTITVARTEGDNAPAHVNAARLIDASVSITNNSVTFDSATVTFGYDELLLGGLAEGDINRYYRDASGSITDGTVTVDSINNTITATTSAFSDWYFGNADADVGDWKVLE